MKKVSRIKKNYQFNEIISKGKVLKNKYYIIYYIDNDILFDRFGISVSKKIGNAVVRNRYKRKLRAIIDNYKKNYINHKDYIIILRREAIIQSFDNLQSEFNNLINGSKKG